MTQNLWRSLALFTSAGWGLTILAWSLAAPEPEVRHHEEVSPALQQSARSRKHKARRVVSSRPMARATPAGAPAPDIEQLRHEVREEVLGEIEQERAEHRQRRSERHLSRLLDEVEAFGQEHDLDGDTVAALESSLGTMHDRLEALRPPGPPGPDGPPPEVMEGLLTAFEAFEVEVGDTLQDAEIAAHFTERMTPRPLRDRR